MATLWEILVPRCDNDGVEYSVDYHRLWDERVQEIAGGITITRPSKGSWVNPSGVVFREEMIPVRIYCDEKGIEKIIQNTLEHYDQEAVLAYEISSNVKLVYRASVA